MKINLNTYCKYFLASGITAFVMSCSNTKFLKEGEILYTGGEVKVENDSISKKEKKALGYAVSDINSEELLKNKNTNVINSLADSDAINKL